MHGKIVVYLRISRRDRHTEQQAYAMEQHIQSLASPPEIVQEHASSLKAPLPLLGEIVRRIEAGEISELHMWRVDRAGRNHKNDVLLWDLCERKGVRLYFVSDGYDSNQPGHREDFYDASNRAARERVLIGRRVKERFDYLKKTVPGWKMGGRKSGDHNMDIRDKIEPIKTLYQSDYSIRKIGRTVGVCAETVRRILTQEGLIQ